MSPGPCLCVPLSQEHQEQALRGHEGSWGRRGVPGRRKENGLPMGFVLSYFGGASGASPFPPTPVLTFNLFLGMLGGGGQLHQQPPPAPQGFLSPSLIYGLWLEPLRTKHSGARGEQGGPLLSLLHFLQPCWRPVPRQPQEAAWSALRLGSASKGPVAELEAEVGA